MDDLALLREYAAKKSEAAFETLVARYINVVYSAALRQVGDPHLAEEIVQAVFIILARKAGGMGKGTLLLGWLVRTARFTASAQIRAAGRRRQREQEAYMERSTVETSPDSTWELMSPLLDEALASLNAQDRQAVLLRFLEQKSLAEVGASLAVNEDTARKRVARALEKLRQFFAKRGVVLAAAAIGGAMSANAVQAAPAGLAGAVAAAAFAHTAAGGSTLALVKGALKIMAWTKAKMAVFVVAAVLLALGTMTVLIKKNKPSGIDPYISDLQLTQFLNAPPLLAIQETHFPNFQGNVASIVGDKMAGRDVSIAKMFQYAFGGPNSDVLPYARMVLPADLPENRYDFLVTVADKAQEDFREEIRRVSGYTAHKEIRDEDVLVMRFGNSRPTKFKVNAGFFASASNLEHVFRKPIIDRTGRTNGGDFSIDWQSLGRGREADLDSLKQAILDQLGVELVPICEPVEMLVVERVKN